MKNINLGQTINTLANIGVIGGLAFVGLQLLQDREIAEISALKETTGLMYDWIEVVRESPEVWVKGLAGEPLSPIEAAEFEQIALAWEAFHYTSYVDQPIKGLESEKFVREWALRLYSHPGLHEWWEEYKQRLSYTDPGGLAVWPTAVDEELSRLFEDPPQFGRSLIP